MPGLPLPPSMNTSLWASVAKTLGERGIHGPSVIICGLYVGMTCTTLLINPPTDAGCCLLTERHPHCLLLWMHPPRLVRVLHGMHVWSVPSPGLPQLYPFALCSHPPNLSSMYFSQG